MEELLAQGASRVVAWERETAAATVLFSSFSPAPTDGELSALEALFEDREAAIRSGMVLEGKRFEVHRHHPPLVYGREMGTEPAQAEGAAVCCFEGGGGGEETAAEKEGEEKERGRATAAAAAAAAAAATEKKKKSFAAISYRLPHVSARMVPLLEGFCVEVFGGGRGGGGGGGGGSAEKEEEAAAAAGGGGAA